MFGQITEQFQTIFKNIRGLGKITDKNINDSVRQVRRALIDADVNLRQSTKPPKCMKNVLYGVNV